MSRERRRDERKVIRINEKEVFFRLHLNGRWHPLRQVHDVSISGMGLSFAEAIGAGTPVKIACAMRDLEIILCATVCWCTAHDQEAANGFHRLGVEFDAKQRDDSMLMFMALRKYLDPFT